MMLVALGKGVIMCVSLGAHMIEQLGHERLNIYLVYNS